MDANVSGPVVAADPERLKAEVKAHWEDETCGTRYGGADDRAAYFREIAVARYALEPYIPAFADFASAAGRRVLEIGVGAGSDFENWTRHAAHATGVDLTEAGIRLTRERLELAGVAPERYHLRTADAERLPFEDGAFDLVYSWGVLHHTPDTVRAFAEAARVLRPGGELKAMIYHVPSWMGLMLALRYGARHGLRGLSQRRAVYHHLESVGTKAYTTAEAARLVEQAGFGDVAVWTELGPADLLAVKPSERYRGVLYRWIWRLYPRWLVRLLGRRFGMYLLLRAVKPVAGPA